MKKLFLIFVIVSLTTLTGCGGGGGGTVAPATPAAAINQALDGLWLGSFTSTVLGGTITAFLAISPTNEARYVTSQGVQGVGQISISGGNFTGSGTAFTPLGLFFPNGSSVGALSIGGTGTAKTSLTGTYSGAGDSGTFSFTYDATYDRSSSLAAVSGIWTGVFLSPGVGTVTITISPAGVITGSDTTGCVFNGAISLINPLKNLYTASVTQTVCAGSPLTVNGLAFLSDNLPLTNNVLNFALSNTTESVAGNLGR